MLFYVVDLLRNYLEPIKRTIYQENIIKLPTLAFYILYNGDADEQDTRILRLSDALGPDSGLELTVKLININAGRNTEWIDQCPPLRNYCSFVNRMKSNQRNVTVQ